MGDVLSQSEIDNLLAALSSGELDADEFRESGEKQIKNYIRTLWQIIVNTSASVS